MSTVARFKISDYDRLIATGFFDGPHRRRVELIHGELRDMNPIGPVHEHIVDILTEWSILETTSSGIRVRIQNSVGLPQLDTVPEPDVAWVQKRDNRKGRPKDREIPLIIEVSDSSLQFDRGEKAELYATAGIADYWIVNVAEQCVEVHRQPNKGGYREKQTIEVGQSLAPLALPKAKLLVSRLFK